MSTVTYQPKTTITVPSRARASAARPLPMSTSAAQRLAAVYRLILDRAAEADALQFTEHQPPTAAPAADDASNRHSDGARDLALSTATPA